MSMDVENKIAFLDFLRSMEVKSYTKRRSEKCNTGGSSRSSVYRVASWRLLHCAQRYLNKDNDQEQVSQLLWSPRDGLVIPRQCFRLKHSRNAVIQLGIVL